MENQLGGDKAVGKEFHFLSKTAVREYSTKFDLQVEHLFCHQTEKNYIVQVLVIPLMT